MSYGFWTLLKWWPSFLDELWWTQKCCVRNMTFYWTYSDIFLAFVLFRIQHGLRLGLSWQWSATCFGLRPWCCSVEILPVIISNNMQSACVIAWHTHIRRLAIFGVPQEKLFTLWSWSDFANIGVNGTRPIFCWKTDVFEARRPRRSLETSTFLLHIAFVQCPLGAHLRLSKQELPADDKAKIVSLVGREVAWLTAVGSILLHPIHLALAHS